MSLGVPMGRWNAHTYTSAAAVLAGGLNDGALWILIEGGKPTEAGIWPQVPGGGGGGGDCPLRDSTFVLGELADFFYETSIQAQPPSTALELIYQAPPWLLNDNPTPP